MNNLIEKVLGKNYVNNEKFKEILKSYVLDRIIKGDISSYINTLNEQEQLDLIKTYISSLEYKNILSNNIDWHNRGINVPLDGGMVWNTTDSNILLKN